MFKHLVDKPSAQTVSDIIRNAVEIEQVMYTYTSCLAMANGRAATGGRIFVFFHHYDPAAV